MPSPFPGMDPYLESPRYWQDFHATFVPVIREQIADRLPGDYFARIEEEVVLMEPRETRRARPDVVVARDSFTSTGGGAGVAVAELAPATLHNVESYDERTQLLIEIFRQPDAEAVTVIELLSPTNKDGDGRGIYLEKRERLRRSGTNVVELDLLRGGQRIELSEPLPSGDYHALVSRAQRRPECQVYSWTVQHKLPTIPIPLRPPDADVPLDLAAAFAVAYQRGRYERMVSYAGPPMLDFAGDTQQWVRQQVTAAAKPPG